MLFALGVSHKTAPLAVRERVAVAPERIAEKLDALLEIAGVKEAVLLTTCNRTELYAIADPGCKRDLAQLLDLPAGSGDARLHYGFRGGAAARHLFRVCAGLDSMVVGEAQILGQVKTAYLEAHRAAAVGPELHRLFQHAFEAAKHIRADASLNAPRSLPSAAIKLARLALGGLEGKTALVLGAGKTAETLAFHLRNQGIARLLVANRSRAAAEALAMTYGGEAIALDAIPTALAEAQLLVCATTSQLPLITAASCARRDPDAPLLALDLAVPRDVGPEVASLANVRVVNLDDLAAPIAASTQMRETAIGEAERAVERALAAWHRSRRIRVAVPTICALRAEAAQLRRQTLAEARRIARRRGTDAALEYLATTLSNRLMHAPTVRLREAAAQDETDLIAAAGDLFALDADWKQSDIEAA